MTSCAWLWGKLRELIFDKLFELNLVRNSSVTSCIFINLKSHEWHLRKNECLELFMSLKCTKNTINGISVKCDDLCSYPCKLDKQRQYYVCVSEQEVWFRCRMRLVNQRPRYHKQCDDITRGGRGRPRFPRCAGEKAFLASTHRLQYCFHFHGKQSQRKPTNTFVTTVKFTRRARKMSSPDKAALEKQLTLTLKTTVYCIFSRKRPSEFNIVPNRADRLSAVHLN